MPSSRRLFASSALVGVPLALAGCGATSANGMTPVQQVFTEIQFVLPLFEALTAGIAIAVPVTAPLIATVTPYLAEAGAAFQALQLTMTATAAQPVVQQVFGYVDQVAATVTTLVQGAAPDSKLAQFQPQLTQGNAVLQLIEAFAKGVLAGPTPPTAAALPLPALLHR